MRKTFLALFTITFLFGFAPLGTSEVTVSFLKETVTVDLPRIEFDIHLADGEGVAGYHLMIAYDPKFLKYVATTDGDYLPSGGLFLRPALGADATYELQLSIDDTTTTGPSVVFGEGEEGQTLLLSEFFHRALRPEYFWRTREMPILMPEPSERGIYPYQAVNVLRSASEAADGDGRLATVSFDVLPDVLPFDPLNPDKRVDIHLYGVRLFDADETIDATELEATPVSDSAWVIKDSASVFISRLQSDVNADGFVNILDLTGVASAFGAPVSDANRRADVNADGEINILDLVRVANDLGKPVAWVYNFYIVNADTSIPVWELQPHEEPPIEAEPIQ